jgi:hypothetical protein
MTFPVLRNDWSHSSGVGLYRMLPATWETTGWRLESPRRRLALLLGACQHLTFLTSTRGEGPGPRSGLSLGLSKSSLRASQGLGLLYSYGFIVRPSSSSSLRQRPGTTGAL